MSGSSLLHEMSFGMNVLYFALLCFALLCFALLCFAFLCFALLCFVVPTQTELLRMTKNRKSYTETEQALVWFAGLPGEGAMGAWALDP
jgi:hypothetical protein